MSHPKKAYLYSIPRRTFLRGSIYGAGVAIGLPFLDSVMGRMANAQSASPLRFIAMVSPNGIPGVGESGTTDHWTPTGSGINYTAPQIIQGMLNGSIPRPTGTYQNTLTRNDFTVISNLSNVGAGCLGDARHGYVITSAFSGCAPVRTSGSGVGLTGGNISIDQLIAQRLNPGTPVRSVSLGTDSTGGDTSTYNPIYSQTLSWNTASSYNNTIKSPRELWDQLFSGRTGSGGGGGPSTPSASQILARRRKSILDLVLADANSLRTQLGAYDKQKLDEYITNIRDVENRLTVVPTPPPVQGTCTIPSQPASGSSMRLDTHLQFYFDMLILAFQCDFTRIATMTFASEGSDRYYNQELGINANHHEMSHYPSGDRTSNLENMRRINIFHAQQLAYFLSRLKSTNDAGGNNLLNQSIAMYCYPIGDSNAHSTGRIPFLLAGNAGGQITHRGHVALRAIGDTGGYDCGSSTTGSRANYNPICNVHLRALRWLGISGVSKFGDSTGEFTDLG